MENVVLENNAQFIKKPFKDFLKYLIESGSKHVDLSLIVPHVYIDSKEYKDVCRISENLKNGGIKVNAVTPHPYRYSITAGCGTEQRRHTIEYYKRCIDFAEINGAEYMMITGSGGNFDTSERVLIENAIETLSNICEYAQTHNVTLLLGTVFGEYVTNNETAPVLVNLRQTERVIYSIRSQNLKVYLDTEVISTMGETITEWFETFGEDIRLIRFTDGNYNGYRIWGRGDLPCKAFLNEIALCGFKGLISLQVPGEKYTKNPFEAIKENTGYVKKVMKERIKWQL